MDFNRRRLLKGLGLGVSLPLLVKKTEAQNLLPLKEIQRAPLAHHQYLQSLCFGSCNLHTREQNFWAQIKRESPQLFLSIGDNIYGDTYKMDILERKYKELKNNPLYRQFISEVPMIGTWDDHDYGWNNMGGDYTPKKQSQQLFCDFFNEPENSPRRFRSGIYEAYDFGRGQQKVKVIALDTRFNRDLPKLFSDGPEGELQRMSDQRDILGPEQWTWFEEQLRTSDAHVHLIISSIGVISTSMRVTEDWDKFPWSLQKLLNLLDLYQTPGVVFLSGDKHFGGMFERAVGPSQRRYLEIMSSGLTHSAPYISRPFIRTFFKSSEIYLGRNYGHLLFDWENQRILAQVKDINGRVKLSTPWPIS